MKINVGDYVRTKYGIIAKITHIYEDHAIDCDRDAYYVDSLKDDMPMMEIPYYLKDTYIIKASPNIIDLIEVGDYVNGERVFEVLLDGKMSRVKTELSTFFNEDIKSIVTHEQFESMKYKVGD